MNYFERDYHSVRNGGDIYITPNETKEVVRKLRKHYDNGSMITSNGRKYIVRDGTVNHSIGLQPTLSIKFPTEKGLGEIVEEFGLPL